MLPPFAVQPLVENSVKHGAEQSEEGGEILIATYDRPDSYVVVVQDSFEGFDPDSEETGEGSGTKYVREILSMTVKGTLQIKSRPGSGTVSMIKVPKKN